MSHKSIFCGGVRYMDHIKIFTTTVSLVILYHTLLTSLTFRYIIGFILWKW